MNRLVVVALLLVSCTMVDPVAGQLFRRFRRARPACCCVPASPSHTVVYNATPAMVAPTSVATPPAIGNVVSSLQDGTVTSASGEVPVAPLAASEPATKIASESIASPSDGVAGQADDSLSKPSKWTSLFDGKSLGDWQVTRFGGEGPVVVEDGQITCDFGQYITGVTYKGKDLPKNNYEIELEAKRMKGNDFFCGLTFPVDDRHATFVVGGWGGGVTGISSIDSYDASENDTSDYMEFDNNRWYKIRVRVTPGVLEAWIDGKKMVSKQVESSRLSTRIEVDLSKPLGLCCFDTQAGYRNIRIRPETEPDMDLSED